VNWFRSGIIYVCKVNRRGTRLRGWDTRRSSFKRSSSKSKVALFGVVIQSVDESNRRLERKNRRR